MVEPTTLSIVCWNQNHVGKDSLIAPAQKKNIMPPSNRCEPSIEALNFGGGGGGGGEGFRADLRRSEVFVRFQKTYLWGGGGGGGQGRCEQRSEVFVIIQKKNWGGGGGGSGWM